MPFGTVTVGFVFFLLGLAFGTLSLDSSELSPALVDALESVDESLLPPQPTTAVARAAHSTKMISENFIERSSYASPTGKDATCFSACRSSSSRRAGKSP